ncbi:MAG: TetR/AcrR family transcriptional regulator [Paracoccus sp. (in: a-proteobacteria)]|nr:TetR/AcrR family transcriptional regulator [Paracoccus sp. (in: a-proteobacteria)]
MTETTGSTAKRNVRIQIMDAAERVFAVVGFAGATTRAIADEAKVNLGLIHYHFGSKEELFEQVIARRSGQINAYRRKLLADVLSDPGGVGLEEMLEALIRPTIEMSNEHGDAGQSYSRIIVQIASGTDERSIALTGENFDAIALEFVDAFETHVPGLGRENAVWAYINTISLSLLMMARTGRTKALSGGLCDESDTEASIRRTVRFLAAGTRALTSGG